MIRKFFSASIHRFFSRSRVSVTTAITILLCSAVFCGSANASSCGGLVNKSAAALPQLPVFKPMSRAQVAASSTVQNDDVIVGLWHILFLLPTLPPIREVFDEGFDQFHSDGTEILNDNPSPGPPNGSGDVCLGVFRRTSSGTYQLKHPFWNYDEKGILIGSGVLLETIVLVDDQSFRGSFTFITYDLDGHETSRVEGDLEAERITPD